jgi:hypothetical protein
VKFLFFHKKLQAFGDLVFGPCFNRRKKLFYDPTLFGPPTNLPKIDKAEKNILKYRVYYIQNDWLGHTVSTKQTIN